MISLKKQRFIMFTLIIVTILVYSIVAVIISTNKTKTYHGTFMQSRNMGELYNGYIC